MEHFKRWDLPKGHVDDGESEMECALRELWEETGITEEAIEIDQQFRFSTVYQVQKRSGKLADKELVVFLAELIRPVPIEVTEHLGFRWFSWQPPHQIQAQTIDPVLAAAVAHGVGESS